MRKFIIKHFASYHAIKIAFSDFIWIAAEILFSVLMYLNLISFLTYFISPLITMVVSDGIGHYLEKYNSFKRLNTFWNKSRYTSPICKLDLWMSIPLTVLIIIIAMRGSIIDNIWLFIIPYCFYNIINLYLSIKPMTLDEAPQLVDRYKVSLHNLKYHMINYEWDEVDATYKIIEEYNKETKL